MNVSSQWASLTHNTCLHKLDLSSSRLRRDDVPCLLDALGGNCWLHTLDLSNIDMGGKLLSLRDWFVGSSTVRSLVLHRNNLGETGAKIICQGLSKNSSLHSLDLYANKIESGGAKDMANMLEVNTALKSLRLGLNCLNESGASAIVEALDRNSSLSELDLSENEGMRHGGAHVMAALLKSNNTLRILDIRGNRLFESQFVGPGDVAVQDAHQDALEPFSGIRAFSEGLQLNSSLERLDLSGNFLGDSGARFLSAALERNTSLRSLHLFDGSIGEAGVGAIGEMLLINTSLEELRFAAANYANVGRMLGSVLVRNTSLKIVRILYLMASSDARAIGEALKVNSSIEALHLRIANIGPEGFSGLAEGLKVNTSLRILDLNCSGLNDGGCIALADALLSNRTLQTLDLSCNHIRDKGVSAIAQALHNNCSLTQLSMVAVDMEDQGATELAEALKINTSLQSLDVSSMNKVGCDGDSALLEALAVNSTLRSVDMRPSRHSSKHFEGSHALARLASKVLITNTSLHSLGLRVCAQSASAHVVHESCDILARALRANKTLQTLDVFGATHASHHDGEHNGALLIGTALCDTPRYHLLDIWEPACLELKCIAPALGLDDTSAHWTNHQILTHFHQMHLDKVFAFVMGHHSRLGRGASVRLLSDDALMRVVEVYFGLKEGFLQRPICT